MFKLEYICYAWICLAHVEHYTVVKHGDLDHDPTSPIIKLNACPVKQRKIELT